jgi:hypothetical protein
MPGWDEASVDELLADPIVRDLMAADAVDTNELRALLYGVQRTIERYAATRGGPTSLAGFAELNSVTPGSAPGLTTRARPAAPPLRGRSGVRKSRTFLADRASLSAALGSVFCAGTRCTARS